MIRKLNFERDNNYLLLEDELFRFIRSLDPEKDTSVKIMNGRIDLYIEEQKYDLLPKEELDIQLGRILDGIKNLQTSPKEEVSQSEDKDWRQLIRGKDKLSVPFDPFLNTSNNKKVPVQLHLKRKRARLSLLILGSV